MPQVNERIAAVYDIHGNLPALEAVLRDIRREDVGAIVVGGDVVPGPMPKQVLELLADVRIPIQCIHGNGDREVLACFKGIETPWYRNARDEWRLPVKWTAEQLGPHHERILASWPPTLRLDIGDLGGVLFCHATPRNDTDCFTRVTPDDRVRRLLADAAVPTVVCGHTHMQFDRRVGDMRVINAGSVGMPFGAPGAHWLLLGPDVQLRHTHYDLSEAAARIRATKYPQAESFAAHNILEPPSEHEMLEVFSRAGIN